MWGDIIEKTEIKGVRQEDRKEERANEGMVK